MSFQLIILLALCVIAQVTALNSAGPWQIVAFFYAYRISINAFGVEENAIASQSRGSIVDGSCTLDEFVELTRQPNKNKIPFPKGLIGDDLTPDPFTNVQKIRDSAYDARQKFDASRLLPGYFEIIPGYYPTFTDQLQALRDYVAAARISMVGQMGLNQDFFDIEPNFVNTKAAIHGILDARQLDFNRINLVEVMKILRVHGISPVIRTVIPMGSEPYLELDTTLTINSSTSPAMDAGIVVNRVIASMGLLSEDGNIRRHAAVIRKLEEWIGDLNASF
ncbi:uncharacterized protein EAE97_002363 [Botrytis byssoidea]|uniref:Uncharacterized protein n=1 Tax=Botrytis byssoidea TaxID=139641 RepID=A0A9P5M7H1_9HELO|nr:uncharacterized protein EAE97_002363 [Botrytis byssoidea]KAF7950811.1 hypothetical protein EAE97_002363 [Botrytis byssoidea]